MCLCHLDTAVLDTLDEGVELFTDFCVNIQPPHPSRQENITTNMVERVENVMKDSHHLPKVWLSVERILGELTGIVIEDVLWWGLFVFENRGESILSTLTPLHQMEPITTAMLWTKVEKHVAITTQ